MATPVLNEREFNQFRKLAYDSFGLNLTEHKFELVAARLGKIVRQMELPSYSAYYEHVIADRTGESLTAMIDALSTNHTSFLRETQHFRFLRERLLPVLRKRPSIDVWSAPCSTGEEVYSILITILEELGVAPAPPLRVFATDISNRALDVARQGVYLRDRLSAISPPSIQKYFTPLADGMLQVNSALRQMVTFERMNLVQPISGVRVFPLIFCRNMMIYFDKPTQERLVHQLTDHLEPGGFLFIGHSESLLGIQHSLTPIQPAIFQKPDKASSCH
jgi:chemotaxis protein methyltransferase CheR